MNSTCSSKLFYSALKQVPNRHAMPEWEAIATVQRPAKEYEQEYQKWLPDAEAYLKQTGSLKVSESVKLPTLKSIDVLNWLGTRKDKESPIVEGRDGKYVLMTATSRVDQFGSKIYRVSKVKDKQVLESKDAVSGFPGSSDRNNKQAGSGQPLPIGEYQIGSPERGNFDPAIGSLWLGLYPRTNVGTRSAFGIHSDLGAPGSAGCLAFKSDKDTEDLAKWQSEEGYTTLIVK